VSVWSDFYDTLSRYVSVAVPPGDGILTVKAVPMLGTPAPVNFVVLEKDGLFIWHGGPGMMNYPVKAGTKFLVVLTMPPGFTRPRWYRLTSSFHASE
jgi:hypothetical protein